MLYRYFIGTGETDIVSVEQVYELYRKGMINKTSKLYDVDKNVYVEAYEVPEFIDVFLEVYTNESKSSKLLKYIVSTVFFLLFLLISMINAFLNLGIEEMEKSTTYFLMYMIGTFLGIVLMIALVILIFTKIFKKHSAILIISSSIIMFAISTFLLVNTIGTVKAAKAKEIQKEKVTLAKIITLYEASLADDIREEDVDVEEYGEFAPLVSETQKYVMSLNRMNVGVNYLFKNIHINQIISSEVLSSSERIKQNRESIKVVLDGLMESKAEAAEAHDIYTDKIDNLAIPSSVKEEFVSAAKKNSEVEKDEKENLYDFNIKLFQRVDEMLEYYEDRMGRYTVTGNLVLFNDKSDEDNYAKLLGEYRDILEQYNKAYEASSENDERNLQILKSLLENNY